MRPDTLTSKFLSEVKIRSFQECIPNEDFTVCEFGIMVEGKSDWRYIATAQHISRKQKMMYTISPQQVFKIIDITNDITAFILSDPRALLGFMTISFVFQNVDVVNLG